MIFLYNFNSLTLSLWIFILYLVYSSYVHNFTFIIFGQFCLSLVTIRCYTESFSCSNAHMQIGNRSIYLSRRHVFHYSFASLMSFRACMQWKKNLFAESGWWKHHEARGTKGFPKGRSFPNFRFCSNWLALLYLLGFLLHVLCLDDRLNLHFDIDHKA